MSETKTLLLVEHDGQILSPETEKALTAALQFAAPVHALVAGVDAEPVATTVSQLSNIERVLLADDPTVGRGLAEPLAELIVSLADQYDNFIAAATSSGKNVMPRVAALLDVMQVSDIIAVERPSTFRRPIYAGNAIETVEATDPKRVVTVRTAAFEAAEAARATDAAPIEMVVVPGDPGISRFIGEELTSSERPDLASASVVISGGRALGSKEDFDRLILPLADRLNGAVGASRAAVDAGYAPNDWQVGQTGKVVAPDLYIACGISGAIQHVAGMKDSRVVVAINKDPEAPI
ncbi:MAG: electron transfer flavoprotein subunit alpha/FixB family protein, partial [Hyphomicrobiales bacterium]|nr:electron transfer flavoprotein subunit alpha/FixB family protein [Hyphomicrobiales bacterium]